MLALEADSLKHVNSVLKAMYPPGRAPTETAGFKTETLLRSVLALQDPPRLFIRGQGWFANCGAVHSCPVCLRY